MLSITVTSRNDDHGGGQIERFDTFLHGLAQYRQRLGADWELVICEWNPPPDRPRLHEALDFPASLPWRIYTVSTETHALYPCSDAVPVLFQFGQNAAIRRAQGEWVLSCSQDLVFSDRLARFLAHENLSERAFYRANRVDSTLRAVTGDDVAGWVAQLGAAHKRTAAFEPGKMQLHTRACGDFVLMHISAWWGIRGFVEVPLFGIYLDGLVLHMAHAAGLTQQVLDPWRCVHHIDHDEQGVKIRERFPHIDYELYQALCRVALRDREKMHFNNDDWGLAAFDEIAEADNVWELTPPADGATWTPLARLEDYVQSKG
jgi:hypothetical protein